MFKFLKRKSKVDILEEEYQKLMKQSFDLSKVNRAEADKKYEEAQNVLKKIENIAGSD